MNTRERNLDRGFLAAAVGLFLLLVLPVAAAPRRQSAQPQARTTHPQQSGSSGAEASRGEEKFKQNCSRCHEAPQGFSPRITGTILRHMRVRASLSAKDERDILRFLNP